MGRNCIKSAVRIFAVALILSACAESSQVSNFAGNKTYVYENEGFGSDFSITINEDGSFSYVEGALSSHIGIGNWTLTEDNLLLSDTGLEEPRIFHFKVDGDTLIFLSENSDDFLYVEVSDGEKFMENPE